MKKLWIVVWCTLSVLGLVASCERPPEPGAKSPTDEPKPLPYLKGQLHAHSSNSGDSKTPPADVVKWYEEHKFDFLVFTDHNTITEIERPDAQDGSMLVIPGVELTLNLRACSPKPEPGYACLLHMNALFVEAQGGTRAEQVWYDLPQNTLDRTAFYGASLAKGHALGGLVMLNHPNFHYAADASIIIALAAEGLRFMEVANEAWDSNNTPAGRPSTEDLWDAALSAGYPVWGVATDDAHHYYDAEATAARGEHVFVGDRGYVMVRAERTSASIKKAMLAGDFYFTNGVHLESVDRDGDSLQVRVEGGEASIRFIGKDGALLSEIQGKEATYQVSKADVYARAVIERDGKKAWTQPVWAALDVK